jgi:anaerobic ribonucleoside-triphosphate reductase activating protein
MIKGDKMNVKISGIVKESIVDGPGVRYVIFAQGCMHDCAGCHNPQTHDINGGYTMKADEIVHNIISCKYIDGVTFSGGDPFFQAKEFEYIAKRLKEKNIHIVAYTGFSYEQLIDNKDMKDLLEKVDILIDGPFLKDRKTLKLPFRGSENQRMIEVKKSLLNNKIELIEY